MIPFGISQADFDYAVQNHLLSNDEEDDEEEYDEDLACLEVLENE